MKPITIKLIDKEKILSKKEKDKISRMFWSQKQSVLENIDK